MNFTIEIPDAKVREIVAELVCCAFEGGSNYWYRIDGYVYPEGKTRADLELEKAKAAKDKFDRTFFPHIDLPLMGGGVKVRDTESAKKGLVVLDWEKCVRGLKLMAECASMPEATRHTHPRHWQNVLNENTDAETGDVFLQLALWGEVIYG
jgi:hypothetical protein